MEEYLICEMCLERTTLKTELSELPERFQVGNIKKVCFDCEYQIDKKLEQLYLDKENHKPYLNIKDCIKEFIEDYKFNRNLNEHNFNYIKQKGYTLSGEEIVGLIEIKRI